MAFVVVALFLVLVPVRGLLVEMEGSTFLVEYLVIFDGDLTSSAEDSPSEVPSAAEDLLFGEDSLLLEVDLTSVEVLLMVGTHYLRTHHLLLNIHCHLRRTHHLLLRTHHIPVPLC